MSQTIKLNILEMLFLNWQLHLQLSNVAIDAERVVEKDEKVTNTWKNTLVGNLTAVVASVVNLVYLSNTIGVLFTSQLTRIL